MDQSEKWDAEGFWVGGLDLGGWGESSPNRIKSDRFQTRVILHPHHRLRLRATSIRAGCCGPKKLLRCRSPVLALRLSAWVWVTLNSSWVQTSFAGAWRWSRLLTFPSGQSQKDFGTPREIRGPKPFNLISLPGFEAATLLHWLLSPLAAFTFIARETLQALQQLRKSPWEAPLWRLTSSIPPPPPFPDARKP